MELMPRENAIGMSSMERKRAKMVYFTNFLPW